MSNQKKKDNNQILPGMSVNEVKVALSLLLTELDTPFDFIDDEGIDGDAFQTLDHNLLEKFGVKKYGVRDKILRCKFVANNSSFNSSDLREIC